MSYRHQFLDGRICELPVGKAVCVGRNYAQHAKELNNPVPEQPLLFLKPSTSMVPLSPSFSLPADAGDCHHELEVALLIGQRLTAATAEQARAAIVGVSLGLDLTLRDRQQALKTAGHPWEIAKAFDGALPLAPFLDPTALPDLTALEFSLEINGALRQHGSTADMLTPILPLLVYMTRFFTLLPGDVVMTGTPAGVAALRAGDQLVLTLADRARFVTRVA
ncbi:fumarylacetoacetate hydrolase family protein [Permianibacter sp. IMCC34836]|uniref:fumarylacetoacetate hydrolase family protein n=1 Tax=Permianibacter fluminis TaxID=2738515 RepID=UPI001552DD6F|nr:fumarylacetoacetate hydrolase family protein [Permianibacter fluminis]NQD38846.1 fumarylacetoacetate hydrolase family protein [Permianibacter fluminis]